MDIEPPSAAAGPPNRSHMVRTIAPKSKVRNLFGVSSLRTTAACKISQQEEQEIRRNSFGPRCNRSDLRDPKEFSCPPVRAL
jgi:hypothetical protein